MCSWRGSAVCEARKDELCHCLCPSCCFSNEGSALGHWKVPKSTPRQRYSTADIQPSRGTAQVGYKYDFVSGKGRSKQSLGGMAQATGLAVLPHSTAPEPGSSLAWRHPLPSSGDKESKPGGPQQGSGLLGQSRPESRPRRTACSSRGSATTEHEAEEGCCSWRAPQSSRPAHSPRPRVSHHASHDHREEVLVAQPHVAHKPRVLLAEGIGCALELHADLNEAVELDAGVGGSLGVAGQQ